MDPDNSPSPPVLILLGFLFVGSILVYSLSTTEKVLVALVYVVYRMHRRFDIVDRASNLLTPVSAMVTPSQKFSDVTHKIYKTRLQGRRIRLLRLLPAEPGTKLQCRLVEASLDTVPSYEALSYVWGRPSKRETIECDGHDACIATSLAQALHRLRSRTAPRTLWADGVCINQDDVAEKGHQVERMGEIFKRANRVLVWLGPDKDGSVSKAMTVVRYIYEKVPNPEYGAGAVQALGNPTIENLDKLLERDKGIKTAWGVLGRLFERDWWRRVWCVQEAILARKTVVICGKEEIDGDLIGHFTRWHHAQRWAGQLDPPHFNGTGLRSAYQRLNRWEWSGTFLEILDSFRGLQATDPRDKIYALLGLSQFSRHGHTRNPMLSVNYLKTVPEVLFDSLMHSVRLEGNLHFLSYIDHGSSLKEHRKYPSWMPRWDETREPLPDRLWCTTSTISAGLRASLADSVWTFSDTLTLKGVHLDSVIAITDPCQPNDDMIGEVLYNSIEENLRWVADQAKNDVQKYHRLMIKLATTLTGGYLKLDGWPEGRLYLEHLEEDMGRQYLADFYAFIQTNFPHVKIRKYGTVKNIEGHVQAYHQLVKTFCSNRRIFRTEKGYIGLGPRCMYRDDMVAVLDGGKIPYVLRPVKKTGEFDFVGECFVYDVLASFTLDVLIEHGYEEEDFVLR